MYIRTSNQERLDLGFGGNQCKWGGHFGGLYETAEERDGILMGFLNSGDAGGDLQLYCPVEQSVEDFKKKYASSYPDSANHPDDSEIFQLLSAKDLYYPDGEFSPRAMDEWLAKNAPQFLPK